MYMYSFKCCVSHLTPAPTTGNFAWSSFLHVDLSTMYIQVYPADAYNTLCLKSMQFTVSVTDTGGGVGCMEAKLSSIKEN